MAAGDVDVLRGRHSGDAGHRQLRRRIYDPCSAAIKCGAAITVISTFGLVFASVYSLSMLHRACFGKAKSEVAAKELPGMSLRELSIILLLVAAGAVGLLPAADPRHLACCEMSNIQQWFVNSVSTTRP